MFIQGLLNLFMDFALLPDSKSEVLLHKIIKLLRNRWEGWMFSHMRNTKGVVFYKLGAHTVLIGPMMFRWWWKISVKIMFPKPCIRFGSTTKESTKLKFKQNDMLPSWLVSPWDHPNFTHQKLNIIWAVSLLKQRKFYPPYCIISISFKNLKNREEKHNFQKVIRILLILFDHLMQWQTLYL